MSILDAVKNFAKVTPAGSYSDNDTVIALASGHGALLPQPTTDGPFNLVWWNKTDYADPADDPSVEIIRVISRSADTITVTRGQESTTATVKNITGKVYGMHLALTKKTVDDISNKMIAYSIAL